MSSLLRRLIPIAALLLATLPLLAEERPIQYVARFPAPQTHYVEVEAHIPTDGKAALDLMMPVWTPGSYMVRDYSRNIEKLEAHDAAGHPLAIEKTRKNHWRVTTEGAPALVLNYRTYGHEMTVQSDWIGTEFALLQGAATFITRADALNRPHEVRVELPAQWKQSISGMPSAEPNQYRAADYDTLVDSPIAAGNPTVYEFEVGGKKNLLVNIGDQQLWDGPAAARDVQKIVEQDLKLWGFLPYDRYVFFNFIVNSGGGLEHKTSTVMMTRPDVMRTRNSYRRWLGLVSHEYFHAWNVKRLRPIALGPFDYDQEVYTPDLWVSEGFTSYYGDLVLRRAGLITQKEYLDDLSDTIEQLQTTPGRLSQPVDLASYDAWIRLYHRDENSGNVSISYYTKGEIIGYLLDAQIRAATGGQKSLDDAMRLAYQRYSGVRGFRPEEFEAVVSEVGGKAAGEWLHRISGTAEELDYAPALSWYGLKFAEKHDKSEQQKEAEKSDPRVTLGIDTHNDAGRLMVTQVKRGTTAYDSGIEADDEILAIGGFRVTPDQWPSRLQDYRPGQKATLTIARRLRLMTVDITVEKEPEKLWHLERDAKAVDAQKAHLASWSGQ
jgi:predicted metalloprotease with PDZ domain